VSEGLMFSSSITRHFGVQSLALTNTKLIQNKNTPKRKLTFVKKTAKINLG